MRPVLAAAAVAAALLAPPAAHAEGAVVLTCDLHFTTGTGSCNVYGVARLAPYAAAPLSMTFASSSIGPCLTSIQGYVYGPVTLLFSSTVVGAVAATATNGDITGGGWGAFVPVVGAVCAPSAATLVTEIVGV